MMIAALRNPPRMNAYRRNILAMARPLLSQHVPFDRALDFGCGDGLFARLFEDEQIARQVVPVDVMRRGRRWVDPVLYDGQRLPFADRSFPLVYAMDVLHHCRDPRAALKEMLRCATDCVLIKDHTYRTLPGRLLLCLLDEVGNRRFGVPSLYRYQRGWEWLPWLEQEGFIRDRLVCPATCHTRGPERFFNRFQFLGLWRRAGVSLAPPAGTPATVPVDRSPKETMSCFFG